MCDGDLYLKQEFSAKRDTRGGLWFAQSMTLKLPPDNPARPSLQGRRFMLLQGPSSRFLAHLGRALVAQGAQVTKIGFCPGERVFWSRTAGEYIAFRGSDPDYAEWMRAQLERQGTTDILMLGDGRTPHRVAIECCEDTDVNIWVFEHGYLRPDLILIEPDGMGGRSLIPAEFAKARDAGGVSFAENPARLPHSFLRYAALDVVYHVCNLACAWLRYPHYRAHSGIHPLAEYTGWIRKALKAPLRRSASTRAFEHIAAHEGPLFLFPLQLSHDQQLKLYGCDEPQEATLERVIGSFLSNAPRDACLVVKAHPLDNDRIDWSALVTRLGQGRTIFVDAGDLDVLLGRVAGVVTINSTVGLSALLAGRPTKVLGQSVYDLPELTAAGPLDGFWGNPAPPNMGRVRAFEQYLRHHHHVRGSFDGPGAVIGARNLASWLARHGAVAS